MVHKLYDMSLLVDSDGSLPGRLSLRLTHIILNSLYCKVRVYCKLIGYFNIHITRCIATDLDHVVLHRDDKHDIKGTRCEIRLIGGS